MANLAIKGHATRGKGVIEILEMLGGKNDIDYDGSYTKCSYFLDNSLICSHYGHSKSHHCYTLEEFLKKFPYKVGNKVSVPEYESKVRIDAMNWDGFKVQYLVFTDETEWYSAEELNQWNEPYKEETMEDKPNLLQQLKDYFDSTPRGVIEKEWHEYDKYNEISPKVNEYLEYVNNIRQHKYLKMNLCRNKRGGLFLCDYYTVYNKKEDIWTNCIGNPDGRLYPEVTFENSPQEVELKLINQ